jgi:ribonuclease P protein component
VFRRGHRIERPSLVMVWRETGAPCRVGFAVSRQMRGAVTRNRARRRLREAYRRAGAPGPAGVDVVLIARPAALTAPFDRLVQDVGGGLRSVARGGRNPRE